MKSTKINAKTQRLLSHLLENYPLVTSIVKAIDQSGGRAYLVGGAVRDLLLERPVKDLDIEIHALPVSIVEKTLGTFGTVNNVGKSFGVLRVTSLDVDWSLPRRDSTGRKPVVHIDTSMAIEEALRRRDLTMNAMAIDLTTKELIDPFGGQEDMENNILATPDQNFFTDDPLRFYRVVQFIGRFRMSPNQQLTTICKQMSLAGVSKERISDEFEKLLLKSQAPSLGFRWLVTIGRLTELLPELGALIGVAQNPQWHPEGDVFEHTMQTLDAAATFTYTTKKEKLIMLFSALCHDLGKATTTVTEQSQPTSYGHEKESAALTAGFLRQITIKKDLVTVIKKLVRYHMQPLLFISDGAGPSAYKRLAKKLAPEANIHMLALLACADRCGRNPTKGHPLPICDDDLIQEFLSKAKDALVLKTPEKPLLLGRDFLDIYPPGPTLGLLTKRAYEIQLEQNIQDKDTLKKIVLAQFQDRTTNNQKKHCKKN